MHTDLPGMKCSANTTMPQDIVQTNQRPDIVLVNRTSIEIIVLELTVSFEQCMAEAKITKRNRYAALVNDVKDRGFDCTLFTI